MLSSFGRCYMEKDESPFKFTFVYRPAQSWLFVLFFAVLPSNFKRPYLFNRLADLGEFYVESKGFPCSTQKSSDFGRMDEKEGAFLPHVGPFQGLKLPGMAPLVTWGTGLDRSEIRMPCCPRLVDATCRRKNLRSSLPSSIAPAKLAVVSCFAFCPPTSKGHIFSTAWPIWVNFMSNQRVFRALRRNRAILEEWTKKEGAFLPHVGPFRGLKLQEWHCS